VSAATRDMERNGVQIIVDGVVEVMVHVVVAPVAVNCARSSLERKELPSRPVFEPELVVAASTSFQCL
jgi:hypothetical protein